MCSALTGPVIAVPRGLDTRAGGRTGWDDMYEREPARSEVAQAHSA